MKRRALCSLLGSTLLAGCAGVTGETAFPPVAAQVPIRWSLDPAGDRFVLDATVDDEGRVLAIVAAHSRDVTAVLCAPSGVEQWRTDVSDVFDHVGVSSLSLAGETAAVSGTDGFVVLDAESGDQRWTGVEPASLLATASAVFAIDEDPYLTNTRKVQVFDAEHGDPVAKPRSGSTLDRAPDDAVVVADPVGGSVRCYEPDGRGRWTTPVEGAGLVRPRIVSDHVLLGSPGYDDGPGVAYSLANGSWRWSWPGDDGRVGLFMAGTIPLVGTDDGAVPRVVARRVPSHNNEVRWQRSDERLRGVGDAAYTTTRDGDLFAVDPVDGATRWRHSFGEDLESLLPLADGRGVLVKTTTGLSRWTGLGRMPWSLALDDDGMRGGAVGPNRAHVVVSVGAAGPDADFGERLLSLHV